MMKKHTQMWLVGLLTGVWAATMSLGDTVYWNVESGDWSEGGNWDGGQPGALDLAYVQNGGTATVTQVGEVCSGLYVRDGGMRLESGDLFANNQYFGNGAGEVATCVQVGGSNVVDNPGNGAAFHLGYKVGSTGVYTLAGGHLIVMKTSTWGYENIGSVGYGHFIQTGGTNISAVKIGAGQQGVYDLIGGRLFASVGAPVNRSGSIYANGTLNQSGGRFDAPYGMIELKGTINLTGGEMVFPAAWQGLQIYANGTLNMGDTNGTGSVGSGPAYLFLHTDGVVRGWGTNSCSGRFDMSGRVIADGWSGTTKVRTLNMSDFTDWRYPDKNTTSNGWFAVNRGKLLLHPVTIPLGTSTHGWGALATGNDLVNGVRFYCTNVTAAGAITNALLALDRPELGLPQSRFVGAWQMTGPPSLKFASLGLEFRYDDSACTAKDIDPANLMLWHSSGGSWTSIPCTVNTDDKQVSATVTALGVSDYFALGSDWLPGIVNSNAAVGLTEVTLNGWLTSTGTDANVSAYVFWGTNDAGEAWGGWDATHAFPAPASVGLLSANVTPTALGATHYYRFYATNALGGAWASSAGTFDWWGGPVVDNAGGAIDLSPTSATLQGHVTAGNPAPHVWIYWGTADQGTDKTLWDHVIDIGVTDTTFSSTVTILPTKTYYYRCYASNAYEEAWSEVSDFIPVNVHYVNQANPSPASPFTSWATAATNIQNAVDAAANDHAVVLSNDVYYLATQVTISSAITVCGLTGKREDVIVDGSGTTRCFYLTHASAVLADLTVTNGYVASYGGGVYLNAGQVRNCLIVGNWSDAYGGGIYTKGIVSNCWIAGNTVSSSDGGGIHMAVGGGVFGCIVSNNTALTSSGGGIYNGAAANVIQGCEIVSNTAQERGGGVRNYGLMTNCLVLGNSLLGTGNRHGGGGVYMNDYGTVTDCRIIGNEAGLGSFGGGGITAWRGHPNIYNCLIASNVSSSVGGGLYFMTTAGAEARNCVIVGNTTLNRGGGIAVSGYGYVYNSRVTDNAAATEGGGIYSEGGSIVNCTTANNQSTNRGGGIRLTSATAVNCVSFANRSVNNPENDNWYVTAAGVFTNCCTLPTNGIPGAGNIEGDPLFVDTDAGNYRLQAASPCVDTGLNQPWMITARDLDGTNCRIVNATVDVGAYEYSDGSLNCAFGATPRDSLVPTANQFFALVSDTNPATLYYRWDFNNDGVTDQEGTGLAEPTHSYTVPGYYSPVLTASNGLGEAYTVTNRLYIKAGPIAYYVATNGADQFPYTNWTMAAVNLPQVFNLLNHDDTVTVNDGTYPQTAELSLSVGATVASVNGAARTMLLRPPEAADFRIALLQHADAVLAGFTLANGRTTVANSDGGGAYLGPGMLDRCVVSNCYAARHGGGVFLLNSTSVQVRNCVLVDNRAGTLGGGVAVNRKGVVESCTIVGNTASNAGGGVASIVLPGLVVLNSVVYGNTGVLSGDNWTVLGSGTYAFTNCCTTPLTGLPGTGNIESDPLFKNSAAGNYRLRAGSPCFNTGLEQDWMDTAVDLDGQPRVLFKVPDIGAYEYPHHKGVLIIIR